VRSAIEGVFCARGDAARALANWDEATYVAVVREFLLRPGLTLHYNGMPFFEPPLMM
jgi:hypothetical protein